jgi:cytochrome o ubiquinol oxidase operon protein cyoD
MATHTHTGDQEGHGSIGAYIAGFILSVVLTAAAFGLVMAHMLSPTASLMAIGALALIQIVVHLVFFLHMNGSSGQRWNVMAFVFTVITAVILIGGTLWVMYNANMLMMS